VRKFDTDLTRGASWTLRYKYGTREIAISPEGGNFASARAAFDACVAAIPKRRAVESIDVFRPEGLLVTPGDPCLLAMTFEPPGARVQIAFVERSDSPNLIVTGFVRTADDRAGVMDLAALGGQQIGFDDLPTSVEIGDAAMLRAKFTAGAMLTIPVRSATGDLWTLAIGGTDEVTTFAIFDACARALTTARQ
jgi:hypothetical protein